MKFLFVCSSCGGGGAERVAVRLSNAISQLGNEVVYMYWKEKKNQEYDFYPGVEVVKIQDMNILLRILRAREIIDKSKPDVIFSFADVPNIVVFYAEKIAKHKFLRIPNIRTNVLEKSRNVEKNIVVKSISKLHGVACRSAAMTISNSLESRDAAISHFGVKPDKVVCIYNPVFDDLHLPCFIEKAHETKRKNVLSAITIGRLTKAKNHHMLLESVYYAINSLKVDMSLDIYGDGELFDEILLKIKRLGLEGRVFLKGFDKNIEKKISDYDVFLFSSRWEGLPNALIEALGSGVYIIATDCPSGPREILKDGRFGKLVKIDDYKAMAESIAEVYHQGIFLIHSSDDDVSVNIELKKHLKQFTIPFVVNKYIESVSKLSWPS
ncbi:glycosyltransferase [Litchfieldella rifensis]|uniref:Glycosyltransferase n=1 Tax=Litchfieldella rifensis TaxID=762643 RepID=A0ABV7LTM1_9GAMM